MTDGIQWTEPKEITEQKLRGETLPSLHKMFRQCKRYVLIAGIPLVALGYFVNGAGFSILVLFGLAVMTYQVPFLIWMNIRQARRSGVRYQTTPKGIQVNQRFYLWRQVEGYNFSDSSLRPDIGNLNIKLRQRKAWQSLSFDRHDVDQQELRMILERFVSKAQQPTTQRDSNLKEQQ